MADSCDDPFNRHKDYFLAQRRIFLKIEAVDRGNTDRNSREERRDLSQKACLGSVRMHDIKPLLAKERNESHKGHQISERGEQLPCDLHRMHRDSLLLNLLNP